MGSLKSLKVSQAKIRKKPEKLYNVQHRHSTSENASIKRNIYAVVGEPFLFNEN